MHMVGSTRSWEPLQRDVLVDDHVHALAGDQGAATDRPTPTWADLLARYETFEREQRGLQKVTVRQKLTDLRRFAEYLESTHGVQAPLGTTPQHIEAFYRAVSGNQRYRAASLSHTLRGWFRFLTLIGYPSTALLAAVPRVRLYSLSHIPRALTAEQVQRLFHAIPRHERRGVRDHAILVLMWVCGVRARDLVALDLDNVHWKAGRLSMVSKKTRRPLAFPLIPVVGAALADYVLHARPESTDPALFTTDAPPYQRLTVGDIADIVRALSRRAGVMLPPRTVTYGFRHGFAAHLVRQGFPLETVRDCLGHMTSKTTLIYTKLGLEQLRQISLDPRTLFTR